MKTSSNKIILLMLTFLLAVINIIVSLNCSNPDDGGKQNPNVAPRTRLSNVPPPEDTTKITSPRLTLNWIGDDADGYVAAFRYRWNYMLDNQMQYRKYKIILNLIVEKFALMIETEDLKSIPPIYKHFVNLLGNDGLSVADRDSLTRGDTITVLGTRVYASNPDSIRLQTGNRVRYTFPIHTNPNSGTFIFESPDLENLHTFEISAIDNNGSPSSTPAEVSFITPQVKAPYTRITGNPQSTVLVRNEKTATFPGIRFEFKGVDPNTRTMDYRWVIDKEKWLDSIGTIPWSEFTTNEFAYVTAANFPDPYDTVHTFYVQARNEFGVIDTVGLIYNENGILTDTAWRTFRTIYPEFLLDGKERILLINNGADRLIGNLTYPYYWDVDSFYHNILHGLGKHDSIIDNFRMAKFIFPTLAEIGKYSIIILHADILNFSFQHSTTLEGEVQSILKNYCYIGGDLIITGWNLSLPFNTLRDPEFFRNILHVDENSPGRAQDTLVSVIGQLGYPDLSIDWSKADISWPGGLEYCPLNIPYGFGEIIHKFDGLYKKPSMQNGSLSVRYKGVTFNSAYIGVPLYYMERPAVDSTISHILQDFKQAKMERLK
ncbi:MAG: hypothetical protein HY964_09295 [Ignavibacteriales bacterium]|nr:hypothetical protein [Ignavibacteriales bacterium]